MWLTKKEETTLDNKKTNFNKLGSRWKKEFWKHKNLIGLSIIFLILSVITEIISGHYTTKMGSALASDIILDHIGPIYYIGIFSTQWIFVYGYIITVGILLAYPLFFQVKKLHVAISQFSFLVMVRSFFVSLTHLQTPIDAVPAIFPKIFGRFVFENDLFFSGHVAVPFMGYLIFKKEPIGKFFLIASILLGIIALIMHRHYTIDVLAAYFITYGIFKIGNKFFSKIENNKT